MIAEMVELLEGEGLLDLAAAAQCAGVTVRALRNWIRPGVQGVVLEHLYRGGRIYTSAEALRRFTVACTAARVRKVPPPPPGHGERVAAAAMASVRGRGRRKG